MTAVLGLTGLKGCGKDTAARALIDQGWERMAFADPLRQMLYTLDPLIGDPDGTQPHAMRWQEYMDAVGYDQAKKHPEVRRLMQVFGTEVIRQQFGESAWVDLMWAKIRDKPGNYVLTDVRFDNEAKLVHRLGGFMVRIEREGLSADGHASEQGVSDDLIDAVVPNNGSIERLGLQVLGVAQVLQGLARRNA